MLKHLSKTNIVRWLVFIIPAIVLLYLFLPFRAPIFHEEYSTVVKAENGGLLHVFINDNEQWYLPPDSMSVSEKLKTAVIAFEDESFYSHVGINVKAIARAISQNVKEGKVVSGASTIPMQIARMSAPKKRSYWNKLKEACLAIKLSIHYSKDELLKMYLDHAPYGGNVIGYRTAAFKFYGKDAGLLTWSEAATLAVLPNAPGLIYPSQTSSSLMHKRNRLLDKMYSKGIISEQSCRLAKLEEVPDQFIPFESHAPHMARRLKKENPKQWILSTEVDEDLQKQCLRIASRYKKIYSSYGINNLAILVADTKSGAIKSYVGSPDFFDEENGGQVDGVMAHRSSGSILKPFLFGLSMDEGVVLSETYIRDLPTYFEGFSPRNANREYQGVVSAREALVRSLNIPAVRLLNKYGVYQFYSFLKQAGVNSLFRSADEYGLPLILGGAEVSMWDMVKLYRGMANEGVFSDNHLLKGEAGKKSAQLMSSGSCYLTLDILKDLKRPGSEYFWQRFSGSRPIAWKTGTSYGHKDAWAVGLTPEYTIAVWCGNFDGEGNKNLGGASSAGPILFEILQQVSHSNQWFEKVEMDYKSMEICALSGFRASDACDDIKIVDVPIGMKPLETCTYHQFKFFNSDESQQCCSRCWDNTGHVKKSVLVYPPDIAYYLREKGQFIEPLVSHNPLCPAYTAESALKIIYPNMEAKLFLPRDFDGITQAVVCKVGHANTGKTVYWYLDDHYLGSTIKEHKMGVVFKLGWNQLTVIDENGAKDTKKVFAVVKE